MRHPHYNDHGGEGLRTPVVNARVRPRPLFAERLARPGAGFPILRRVRRLALLLVLAAAAFTLASCGGERRPAGRREPARQGVLGRDPQRRPEARGRDRPQRADQGPDQDRGRGPVPHQRGQAAVGRHRAAHRHRRRRPDDHERRAHDRRPGLPQVPGRLLRAAARAGASDQPQPRPAQGQPAAERARARPALVAGRGQGRGRRGGVRRRHPPRLGHARRGQPDAQPQQVRAPLGERARVERQVVDAPPQRGRHPGAVGRGEEPELRRLRRQAGQPDPARLGPDRVRHPRGRAGAGWAG